MLCHATLPHDRLCNITRSPAWAERGVDQIMLTLHMGVTAKMFLVFFLLVVFTLTFTGSDKIMNISVHMTFDYIYFIKAALGLSPQPNLLQHRYCYCHQVSNPGSAALLAIWRVGRHKYCFILMFVNAIREWHNDVQPKLLLSSSECNAGGFLTYPEILCFEVWKELSMALQNRKLSFVVISCCDMHRLSHKYLDIFLDI